MPTEPTGDMSFDQAAEMSVAELSQTPDKGSAATAPETAPAPEKETAPDLGDPTKLPPELLPHYKNMQGAFTKKMQAISETLESLAPHRERLALLDRAINGDPEALKNLQRIAGVQAPQAPAKEAVEEIPEQFESTKQLMEFIDKRAQSIAKKMLDDVMPQVQQPLQQMQEQAMKQKAMAEIDSMKVKYPDFEKQVPEILRIREEMGPIPLEAAYKLATWSAKVPASQLTPQPGASPKAIAPKGGNAKSFEEAWEMAKEQLGGN